MKTKLIAFLIITVVVMSVVVVGTVAAKKSDCTTIQDGTLLTSDGRTITTGYDELGYNYQGHMFNGYYCDSYRDAAWCQPYKDVKLMMKWNDAWLSNKDCDGDGKLDRHYGYDSYIGSGAWLTNHQSGEYKELMLYEKDPSTWMIIEDGAYGEMVFSSISFDFHGYGLEATTDYTLIRYTDPWPGSPVVCLGENKTDSDGELVLSGLMQEGGSKIWLVLSDDVNCDQKKMVKWNPTEYLFENNLIEDLTVCKWNYFVKIVAAPADAVAVDGIWYTADGTEIGPVIWGAFAIIQEVENDSCA